MNESREMSFYDSPITNKVPCCVTTLAVVMELIKSKKLKLVTELARKDKAKKNRILCYITPSGVFFYCKDSGIMVYSGYLNFDFDNLFKTYGLHPEAVKRLLAADTFLNFNLINISVSGDGIKGILTVKDGRLEEHEKYYSVIERYILDTYGLKVDSSCRNVSRAYYLSYDPDVYYNASGFVDRESLLALLPAAPCTGDPMWSPSSPTPSSPSAPSYVSTATSVPAFDKPTYTTGERPSDLLNRLDSIYRRALKDLVEMDGWTLHADGIHLTREGKKGGTSAIFNYYAEYGFPVMTNYSSSAKSFGVKGWAPVQIICRLEFQNDWNRCVSELARQYLL
jgi:hypothetical protein